MKVKFKKIERVAGLFILTALVGAGVLMAVAAIKKGWFQAKVDFKTRVLSADGIRPGTQVTISGLRAGEIKDIELLSAQDIIVHFEIFEKFHRQIKTDSRVNITRPFVVGDKVMEVTVGSEAAEIAERGAELESVVAFDMIDLVSGKKLGPFIGTLEGLMVNLSELAKAFADPKRTQAFVKMFDRMEPLIVNLSRMSKEMTAMAEEINIVLPQMRDTSPEIGRRLSQLIENFDTLTKTLTPAFQDIGPELPRASRRAIEALDEMVITLKAMQKSFLLSGKVEDVKEEEASERQRKPAGK